MADTFSGNLEGVQRREVAAACGGRAETRCVIIATLLNVSPYSKMNFELELVINSIFAPLRMQPNKTDDPQSLDVEIVFLRSFIFLCNASVRHEVVRLG